MPPKTLSSSSNE
jgi:hypothetical protein